MTIQISLSDRSPLTVTPGKTVCLLSVCSGSSIAEPVDMLAGSDVDALIGYGPGSPLIKELLKLSTGAVEPVRVIHQKVTGGVAGTISSVVETPDGTGPTITVNGPPYDTYNGLVKVVKGGPLGTATVRVALDGGTYGDEIPTVPELPASFTSAVDLTTLTLGDLNALTVIGTSDLGGPTTTTFTTPTSVADIAVQLTAQGAPHYAAEIVSGKYLRVFSLTNGAASTFVFGAGTANALLGLTPSVPYAGAASTYIVPGTGLTLGFPGTSDYVLNTVYSFTSVQPRFSVAAATTAFATLRDWLLDNGVSPDHVFLLVDPVDGAETRQFADLLSSTRTDWASSPYLKYPNFFMGSSLHAASPTKATNDTNITANDAAIKTAMADHVDPFVTVAAGDCYFASGSYGDMRRSVVHWLALFESFYRDSADPGAGDLAGFAAIKMKGQDGSLARNELTATHKMRAARFTAAKKEGTENKIVRGVTRANGAITPKFVHVGVVNAGLRAVRLLIPLAKLNENTDPPGTPARTIDPARADAIDSAGNNLLLEGLVSKGHATAARVTVDRTEVIGATENLTINADLQENEQILSVALNVGIGATIR